MLVLRKYFIVLLVLSVIGCPVIASAVNAPVAIMPLQDLKEGRNGVNLPMTERLAERLAADGNTIIGLDAVIGFMAYNRIRSIGYLETYNISTLRSALAAPFVLLGTITQRGESPEPHLGLTLNLVRTIDARTVWTYSASLSRSDEISVLGIGEPQSVEELIPLLLDEVVAEWPWQSIYREQFAGQIYIDTAVVGPKNVRPGKEVVCRVRLRDVWPDGQEYPEVYFRAGDRLYPATLAADSSRTYLGTWPAGDEDGNVPVSLVMKWPRYGRSDLALLGNYLIDGTPPHFDLTLQGSRTLDGRPVFQDNLVVVPKMLVNSTLSRWRISFYFDSGDLIGDMEGEGDLPEQFTWMGGDALGRFDDGTYQLTVEAWDLAGNLAKVSKQVSMINRAPNAIVDVSRNNEDLVVELQQGGRVPIASWRLETWDTEGRIISDSEGSQLPIKIAMKVPNLKRDQGLNGFLYLRDILGNSIRKDVRKLHEAFRGHVANQQVESTTKSWTDEF